MVNLLIEIALGVCLTGAFTFSILYTLFADWQKTQLGRHMLYFGWSFVLALATNLVRVWFKNPYVDTARVVSLFLVGAVFWQRVYLLVQSLRRSRKNAVR